MLRSWQAFPRRRRPAAARPRALARRSTAQWRWMGEEVCGWGVGWSAGAAATPASTLAPSHPRLHPRPGARRAPRPEARRPAAAFPPLLPARKAAERRRPARRARGAAGRRRPPRRRGRGVWRPAPHAPRPRPAPAPAARARARAPHQNHLDFRRAVRVRFDMKYVNSNRNVSPFRCDLRVRFVPRRYRSRGAPAPLPTSAASVATHMYTSEATRSSCFEPSQRPSSKSIGSTSGVFLMRIRIKTNGAGPWCRRVSPYQNTCARVDAWRLMAGRRRRAGGRPQRARGAAGGLGARRPWARASPARAAAGGRQGSPCAGAAGVGRGARRGCAPRGQRGGGGGGGGGGPALAPARHGRHGAYARLLPSPATLLPPPSHTHIPAQLSPPARARVRAALAAHSPHATHPPTHRRAITV